MLKLFLLGPFVATIDNQPLDDFKTQKVQALLIILAMERGRPLRRERLMEILWPEMPLESAQVNLRQTIYRLRQSIPVVSVKKDGEKIPFLVSDRQFVSLNPDAAIQVDVHLFKAALEADPHRAVTLYRGSFLFDFCLVDSSPFEDWAQQIRGNLQRQALLLLDSLTEASLRGLDYSRAQTFAWRQLEIDNLRENAYRQLMVALVKDGQRNAALSQFHLCQQRLEREMGISPDKETIALYEQIQAEALNKIRDPEHGDQIVRPTHMPVFLLTDIEGSTRLWDQHHQAMLPALFTHNQILDENIGHYGGRILELRGDGVKAVFEDGDPLACMIAIQRDLSQTDWGEICDLRIRAGLHGVPTVRKGYDYFKKDDQYYGPVLNHTARIMDAGWGGQVLVSEPVYNTLTLPTGATWEDLGRHQLKSLDQPIQIYGLIHPDMPIHSFPELRTLSDSAGILPEPTPTFHNNIPPQPTPFVGRREEITELASLLGDQKSPLVTIVGPGGMGITRLALAVGNELVQVSINEKEVCPFPDGIYFVPLVPLNHPEQILPAIAKGLNVPVDSSQTSENLERTSQTTTSQNESLIGYLASKRLLVILDNFEHILVGAQVVSALLKACPSIQILVTSRERLGLREEQIYPIYGLDVPELGTVDDPCDFTAIEFFIQNARRVKPDFLLSPGDITHLTRICLLVGGMPLGLELAASWVDMLTLADIGAEIQSSLDFLGTEVRNMPDRHRSIRAVFDSSWDRLTQSEKEIYPRLSIFKGEFSREAAEEVAQTSLRTLAALASKSLLKFEPENNCYQLHELLRQYASEKLSAVPHDEIETKSRHSRYYCNRINQYLQIMMDGDIHTAIHRTEISYSNVQVALDWAINKGIIENVDLALIGICIYYNWHWQVDKGLSLCNAALELMNQMDLNEHKHQDPDTFISAKSLCAKALGWQGFFNLHYNIDLSRQYLDQGIDYLQDLEELGYDTSQERLWINYFKALVDFFAGDLGAARDKLKGGLSLSQNCNFPFMVQRYLSMLGDVARVSGAPREAKRWYQQSLDEARAHNNRWGEIDALNDLGWAARSMMAYDEARHYYQRSLELSKYNNDQWEMLGVYQSLGWLSIFLGELDQAEEWFLQAVEKSKELGLPHRAISAQIHIGIKYWLSGEFELAEGAIRKSLEISADLDPGAQLFPAVCMAEFFTLAGRYPEAADQCQIVKALTRDIYVDRFTQGRLTRILGFLSLAEKDYETAVILFQESIENYQIEADDEQIAWSQAGLARAMMGQGLWDEVRQVLTEALWTSIEIKGFIPMVFTLPVVLLYLVHEDPAQAATVYQKVMESPFLAKARYFEDIVYQYLPESMKVDPPIKVISHQIENLWNTAAGILSKWIQVWMDPNEVQPDGNSGEKLGLERSGGPTSVNF